MKPVPDEQCTVPECARPYRCKGYCAVHYNRVLATGTTAYERRPIAEREGNLRLARGLPLGNPTSSPFFTLAASCLKCGTLVTNSQPRKADNPKKRSRLGRCRTCINTRNRNRHRADPEARIAKCARTVRSFQGVQQLTLITAERHGYEWTGPEVEVATRADLTAKDAALLLGRSMAAIRTIRKRARVDPRIQALSGRTPQEQT